MRFVRHRYARRELAHHFGSGSDFTDCFLLDSQADQYRRNKRRRHITHHDASHEGKHFLPEYLAVLNDARESVLRCHRFVSSTKCLSRSWPFSVKIDSGWNCTPSTESVLWRTPMISPSSLHAVISRHSGSVSL